MNLLFVDPRAALDHRDGEGWRIIDATFTGDSPYRPDVTRFLNGYVARNMANRPTGDALGQLSAVVNTTDTPAADNLNFVWCSFDNSLTVDVTTGQALYPESVSTAGTGTAHRIAGSWRLYSLQVLGEQSHAQGTPRDCPPSSELPPGVTVPPGMTMPATSSNAPLP